MIKTADDLLISVHSQEGYGHGTGEEEIRDRVDGFDGHTVLLKDEDAGEVYGGEEIYDFVIEDDFYGNLDDDISNVVNQVYEDVELIGIYGSECVANTAESIGAENVRLNPNALVDQIFGEGDFVVSDLLDSGDAETIQKYAQKFRNEDTAGRLMYEGGFLQDEISLEREQDYTSTGRINEAKKGEDAVILT